MSNFNQESYHRQPPSLCEKNKFRKAQNQLKPDNVDVLLMVQKSGKPEDIVDMVNITNFYRVSYIARGAGFQPSTVGGISP